MANECVSIPFKIRNLNGNERELETKYDSEIKV